MAESAENVPDSTVAWVVCPECASVCTDLERHTASLHPTTPEEGTTDGL